MTNFYQTRILHKPPNIPLFVNDKYFSCGSWRKDGNVTIKPNIIHDTILEDGFFLYFNSENAGHCLSQFIISMYEYKNQKLYVSKCIKSMPFLEKLLYLYVDSFTFIEEETLYKCKNMYIPPYCYYYVGYKENPIYDSILHTRTYYPISDYNSLTPREDWFHSFIDAIYGKNHMNYKKHENICILKSQLTPDSTTPHRRMVLSSDVLNVLKTHNYVLLFPHEIQDIIEYICILKSAKNVITSYGNVQCTNRFFFTNSKVKVICNQHYKSEYDLSWHNSQCVGKSLSTTFFLDIPNEITEEQMKHIIEA